MKKELFKKVMITSALLLAFILWTILICFVDVQSIGPNDSRVGFAALNGAFHSLTGVHMPIYVITDWLGLVALVFICGFGFLGLTQLIRRRSLFKVDCDILVLGGYYIVVLLLYCLFEKVVINYRPILIEGYLEASYPSSTTLLMVCVMPTAILQLKSRMRNQVFFRIVAILITGFTGFMVIGRTISGVHWLTDIIGGLLLGGGLVMLYYTITKIMKTKQMKKD